MGAYGPVGITAPVVVVLMVWSTLMALSVFVRVLGGGFHGLVAATVGCVVVVLALPELGQMIGLLIGAVGDIASTALATIRSAVVGTTAGMTSP